MSAASGGSEAARGAGAPPARFAFDDPMRGYRLRLDAEEAALLGLARPGDAALPREPPDWDGVARLARAHRLEPRLHRAVRRMEPAPPIPPAILEAWRRAYYTDLHAVIGLLDQRDRAVRALAAEGIRPLVVKGAALAGVLHADPAVRPMGDVDLLLPPGTLAGRPGLLAALRSSGLDLSRFEIEEDHHDLTMDGIYPLDLAALWRDARPAPFAPDAALVPSIEDQLLLVAVSCCRNSFWNPIALVDAAEILRQHGGALDAERLAGRARGARLHWALDTLLALAAALFAQEAPAGLRERLAPPARRRRAIGSLLADFRLHPGGGLEAVNIARPLPAHSLKYAVNPPSIVARQARDFLLPRWAWMRAHYPGDSPARLVARYAAHPFVVAGLAARLAWDRAAAARRKR